MPDLNQPSELLLFDFLEEQILAAVEGDVLFELELHDTVFQSIKTLRGIRISDAMGEMSPTSDGIKEFGVELSIVCFARVEGKDKKARGPAMQAVWELEKEIYRLLFTHNTLGSRVCDVLPGKGFRSYDVLNGDPYAVANIPLTINPAG